MKKGQAPQGHMIQSPGAQDKQLCSLTLQDKAYGEGGDSFDYPVVIEQYFSVVPGGFRHPKKQGPYPRFAESHNFSEPRFPFWTTMALFSPS